MVLRSQRRTERNLASRNKGLRSLATADQVDRHDRAEPVAEHAARQLVIGMHRQAGVMHGGQPALSAASVQ